MLLELDYLATSSPETQSLTSPPQAKSDSMNGATMDAERTPLSRQDPAIEFIANELHVPITEVAQLYGKEMAKLKIGAHITGFLPIFAIRNVRKLLADRGTTRPISA